MKMVVIFPVNEIFIKTLSEFFINEKYFILDTEIEKWKSTNQRRQVLPNG